MRKLFLIFFVLFTWAFGLDLEKLYLEKGILAVQKAIESNLQSASYWEEKLQNEDLKYGYYDSKILLTLVDKTDKKLTLFSYENGTLGELKDFSVLTGLMDEKLVEGDLKTPSGVYEITRKFEPSDSYYGPVAFALSYPNLYDKARNRTGGGIWIHGYPKEGDPRIDSLKTKGCVVMKNPLLKEYEDLISKDKNSIVIISEKGAPHATNKQISQIFAQIFKWKNAWAVSDVDSYLSFYDEDFKRFDGMDLANFKAMKERIFSRNENKFIQLTDFSITPYPSSKDGAYFRVNCFEKYKTQNYKFNGPKTLYIKLSDSGKMKILVEE